MHHRDSQLRGTTTPATASEETVPPAPGHRPVVAVALVDSAAHPRRMLAGRRAAGTALAGYWEFPGGKVETGETALEALHREIREELGVEIVTGAEVTAEHPEGWLLGNGARMRVFTAVTAPGQPEPAPVEGHDELRWVELEPTSLHALEWIPANRPIVDAVLAVLL